MNRKAKNELNRMREELKKKKESGSTSTASSVDDGGPISRYSTPCTSSCSTIYSSSSESRSLKPGPSSESGNDSPKSGSNQPKKVSTTSVIEAELKRLKFDEQKEIVPPPKGFKGKLIEGDQWHQCPYYSAHTYRDHVTHLVNCRENYIRMKRAMGEEMDIKICQYDYSHHVHEDDLEEHELSCSERPIIFPKRNNYFQRHRARNWMD